MKNFFLLLFLLFFIVGSYVVFGLLKQKVRSDLYQPLTDRKIAPSSSPTLPIINSSKTEEKILFVPYWSMGKGLQEVSDFDTLVYFGVAPTENGINRQESGYKNLPQFIKHADGSQKKLLTLRMIESQVNFKILEDTKKGQKIIDETLSLAKTNGFDGVVLDLEVSALPFDSLVNQITQFVQMMHVSSKDEGLPLSVMLYGDIFYRVRPFDTKEIVKYSDAVYVMAYDFSKSRGNPGPNFPLKGVDTYGYDYESMLSDFLTVTSADKLTIVFGLYGYDWEVQEGKSTALSNGEPLSMQIIQQRMIASCAYISCTYERDNENSAEMQVTYLDSDNVSHRVWYEDLESVKRKQSFLRKHGVTSYGYWAYSYF